MKSRIKKKLLTVVALILVFAFVIAPVDSYAATKNKKGTTYRNTLKSGNIVYCTNANKIFKVNLKTKKVKVLITARYGYTTNLVKKGKYLYYMDMTQYGSDCRINRINLKTGKKTVLVKNAGPEYVINGNKIYYNSAKYVGDELVYKQREMKINGKSKKASKYKTKMISRLTNKAGYKVIDTYDVNSLYNDDYVDYYLRIPNGKIFLGNFYHIV